MPQFSAHFTIISLLTQASGASTQFGKATKRGTTSILIGILVGDRSPVAVPGKISTSLAWSFEENQVETYH